jgi:hypothetical protein
MLRRVPRPAVTFSTRPKERPRRYETRAFHALDDEGFESKSVNFNGHGRGLLLSAYRQAQVYAASGALSLQLLAEHKGGYAR